MAKLRQQARPTFVDGIPVQNLRRQITGFGIEVDPIGIGKSEAAAANFRLGFSRGERHGASEFTWRHSSFLTLDNEVPRSIAKQERSSTFDSARIGDKFRHSGREPVDFQPGGLRRERGGSERKWPQLGTFDGSKVGPPGAHLVGLDMASTDDGACPES